ncbi:hypothetical protein [Desulfosediminicola sp.]|uniref:hypothetical protein n=1 Tax=Desulfosediminicola sp. TaxID=2886825 RepID=UPI003AF232EA
MRILIACVLLLQAAVCFATGDCPNHDAFREQGWVIHDKEEFNQILTQRLEDFLPQVGKDLVLDQDEYYKSCYCYDDYLIMQIVIYDRLSTCRDEMWGDVAFALTGNFDGDYVELRWYDPVSKEKHIVCNPDYVCCVTTKVPLAVNTIF